MGLPEEVSDTIGEEDCVGLSEEDAASVGRLVYAEEDVKLVDCVGLPEKVTDVAGEGD